MIDSKLLPEFQTAELLQPLSGPKAEPRNPSPEKLGGKKIYKPSSGGEKKLGWGRGDWPRRILTSVYPLSVAKLWRSNPPYRKAAPDPGRMAPAHGVRGH